MSEGRTTRHWRAKFKLPHNISKLLQALVDYNSIWLNISHTHTHDKLTPISYKQRTKYS